MKKAIKIGIQKINVNTDLRIIWKQCLGKEIKNSKTVKPYEILPKVTKEVRKKVAEYIKLLGSQNKIK